MKKTKVKHIAFIMDGNRRFAKKNGLSNKEGYIQGLKKLSEFVRLQVKYNLPEITFWALSTENWKNRSPEDLNSLKEALKDLFNDEEEDYFYENGIDINLVGDINGLVNSSHTSEDFKSEVKRLSKKVEEYKERVKSKEIKFIVNICINYGGHSELIYAFKKIGKKLLSSEISIDDIDEDLIKANIFFCNSPAPEIIVRPGDAPRLSGFMSWDSAYSEIFLTKKFWPELTEEDFKYAFYWFNSIKRNFGK